METIYLLNIHMRVYICIYIYIEREREREDINMVVQKYGFYLRVAKTIFMNE